MDDIANQQQDRLTWEVISSDLDATASDFVAPLIELVLELRLRPQLGNLAEPVIVF
jgi:hypothetical protein